MSGDLQLVEAFLRTRPDAAARVLERQPSGTITELLGRLEPFSGGALLGCLAPAPAASCLASMPREAAARLLENTPNSARLLVLKHLEPDAREQLLDALQPRVAFATRRMLRYPPETVGSVMDPRTQTLFDDVDAAAARETIRRSPRDTYYYLYVTDRRHRLVGVVNVKELLLAGARDSVAGIMRRAVQRLPVHAPLKSIAASPAWEEIDALPVVDGEGTFLGVVRHRVLRGLEAAAGQARDPALSAFLSLGELYWVSLYGLVASLISTAPPRSGPPRPAPS